MAHYDTVIYNDLIENPLPRCACMLVLDTSASMDGAPIGAHSSRALVFDVELAQLQAQDGFLHYFPGR